MNLAGIISISGKPGLFKVVAQGKNNIIVESLENKKRFPAYSSDRISALEDISIYALDEDVSLKVILKSIYEKESGNTCISHKEDQKKLEAYLLEVLPNYDRERVYISDVKKIFQWYNLLHQTGELKFEEEKAAKKAPKTAEEKEEAKEAKKDKPAKKQEKTVAAKAKAKPAVKTTVKSSAPKKVAAVKTGTSRGK